MAGRNLINVMTDDFSPSAKKCVQDHRNPIVKITLPSQKILGIEDEEAKNEINGHREHVKKILEHQRVEKRSARAQAVWPPNGDILEVTKVVKNLLKYFGFQNKNGIFMYPEEMLFLLETNRLEVTFDGNILTIEKAYDMVLKITNISSTKYRIYKKLASLGYKLTRFDMTEHQNLSSGNEAYKNTKRALKEETEVRQTKKIKGSFETSKLDDDQNYLQKNHGLSEEYKYILDTYNKITKVMPVDNYSDNNYCLKPDYCVFSPTNVSRPEPDFYLFIRENNILHQKVQNKLPCLSASCPDDVAFYKFSAVHLPYI